MAHGILRQEERIAEGIVWVFMVDKIIKYRDTLISFCRTSSDSLITLALDLVSINIEQKGGLYNSLLKVVSRQNILSPKYRERKCKEAHFESFKS